uniref:NADH-ubiquinone oxidoreductase chain 3 n=1 Tax=Cryptocephalus vittatus TaxID=1425562 RepID=A0A343C2I4_9CUCU|nr:NADH dehydrogenase subunit 3 [Cryptocephalus vittatus]ARH54227.1 NADH dehydrogenase subunit 3 [Cryptocephalus vittatus]
MMISIIMAIMIMILNLISKKSFSDREKSSPFECGFDPKTSARLPFSIQFFLIAIIFLIFDVEIALLMPLIKSMTNTSLISFSLTSMFFIFILIIGLIHEWKQGALNWKIK